MKQSQAVVCNGGSNVIREAMMLRKPTYVLPFNTYEQHCNADVVARNGLGIGSKNLSAGKLSALWSTTPIASNSMTSRSSARSWAAAWRNC